MKLYSALTLFSLFATGHSTATVNFGMMSGSCVSGMTSDGYNGCTATLPEDGTDSFANSLAIQPLTQLLAYDSDRTTGSTISSAVSAARVVKYQVNLTDDSTDYGYRRCEVKNTGGALDKYVSYLKQASPHNPTGSPPNSDMQSFQDNNGVDDSTHGLRAKLSKHGDVYTCEFTPLNNEYIGGVEIMVAFERDSTVGNTKNALVKAKLALEYSPSASDPDIASDQSGKLRDVIIQYHAGCKSAGAFYAKDGSSCDSGQIVSATSDALEDTINLKVNMQFIDTRYKVVDVGGTDKLSTLNGDTSSPFLGSIDLNIEGIGLQEKYMSWNTGANAWSVSGLTWSPVTFSKMKRESDTVLHNNKANDPAADAAAVDFRNRGKAGLLLEYTNAITNMPNNGTVLDADLDADVTCGSGTFAAPVGNCYAQYLIDHIVSIQYGGMPHFQPSYIASCAYCDRIMTISATDGSQKYIDTKVALSILDLPTAPNSIEISGPKLDRIAASPNMKGGEFKRLTELYNVGVNSYILQKDDGNSGEELPTSLDDEVIIRTKFVFASIHPDGSTVISSAMAFVETGDKNCAGLYNLKAYELGTDLQTHYTRIFNTECYLQIPQYYFGTQYQIDYRASEAGAADQIIVNEVDDRTISIGGQSLGFTTRQSVVGLTGVTAIATTINLPLAKTLPDVTIPAGFANPGQPLKDQAITFNITEEGGQNALVTAVKSVTTSTENGATQNIQLTSNDKCTDTIDINLMDATEYQSFAVYLARIPCSRMSSVDPIEDSVDLKFDFSASLDLKTDVFKVHAVSSNHNDYQIEAFFGTCAADNSISLTANGVCTKGTTAGTIKFVEDNNNNDGDYRLLPGDEADSSKDGTADGNGVKTLGACSTNTEVGNNYVSKFNVAMQYSRTADSAFNSATVNYCDDQEISITINRVYGATIVAATIQNVPLERAVLIQDIKWVPGADAGCSGTDGSGADAFRLVILLQSRDQDGRSNSWSASVLKNVQMDPAAENKNSMSVGVASASDSSKLFNPEGNINDNSFTGSSTGSYFKLDGQCVTIADEASDCVVDTSGVQSGGTWSDYSREFTATAVVTGDYNSQDVDTLFKLTMKYEQCPIADEATLSGKIVLALKSECYDDDALQTASPSIQSISQDGSLVRWTDPTAAMPTGVNLDCTVAYSDDVLKVEGNLFSIDDEICVNDAMSDPGSASNADYSNCGLTSDRLLNTVSSDWTPIKAVAKLIQKDVNGQELRQVDLCTSEANAPCSIVTDSDSKVKVGSHAFVLKGDLTDGQPFSPFLACCQDITNANETDGTQWTRTHTLAGGDAAGLVDVGSDYLHYWVPLAPLGQFPSDSFELEVTVTLENSNLNRRRHLRATHTLRSAQTQSASTHALQVVERSVSADSSTQDAPAASAPEQPVAENVASSPSSTESSSEKPWYGFGLIEESAVAGLWVIAVVVWLVILFIAYELVAWALRLCGVDALPSAFSASSMGPSSYTQVSNPVGERFTNLRY